MKRIHVRGALALLAFSVAAISAQRDAAAHPAFLSSIPNNDVYSCSTCHNPDFSRNSFGQAIQPMVGSPQSQWWPAVRDLDSDNDGQANRQELGDPCATWSIGQTPDRTTAISNPGSAQSQSNDPDGPGCGSGSTSSSSSTSTSTSTSSGAGGGQGGADPGQVGQGGDGGSSGGGRNKLKPHKKPHPHAGGGGQDDADDDADDVDDDAYVYGGDQPGGVAAGEGSSTDASAGCSIAAPGAFGAGGALAALLFVVPALTRGRPRRAGARRRGGS